LSKLAICCGCEGKGRKYYFFVRAVVVVVVVVVEG